jgi:LysE type translocator
MGDVAGFAAVAALIVLVPGPDMALVLRNGVAHGRRAAVATALGVNAGLLVWALAAALGIAAVLHASSEAFTVLKLAGAAYLVLLGARALVDAWRGTGQSLPTGPRRRSSPFREGLLSNLLNPKIALVYTTLRRPRRLRGRADVPARRDLHRDGPRVADRQRAARRRGRRRHPPAAGSASPVSAISGAVLTALGSCSRSSGGSRQAGLASGPRSRIASGIGSYG